MEFYNASLPCANLTFIGGGPTALIFLLFAAKTSRLYELISKKGIQILERTQSFGPGTYERYRLFSYNSSYKKKIFMFFKWLKVLTKLLIFSD